MTVSKLIKPLLVLITVLSISISTQAQEWAHGHKGIYSVGLGGSEGIGVYKSDYYGNYHGIAGPGLSINISGEYVVHKYVGVGFQTGVNFNLPTVVNYGYGYGYSYNAFNLGRSIEIPIQAKANFHILEATRAKIKNKLDVYAGLTVGAGPAFFIGSAFDGVPESQKVFAVIHVGPQAGVRYWFNDKVAVFGELGWGATFINGGVTF